jgi:hypothetical protein
MPQGLTNYAEQKVLDTMFGNAAWATQATVWVGLATASSDLEVPTFTEVTGGLYARVAVTNNSTNWPAATQNGSNEGQKQNGTVITFPTANANWGTATHWFVADAVTAGNVWAIGALTTPKAINTNDTASFAAGSITITLD